MSLFTSSETFNVKVTYSRGPKGKLNFKPAKDEEAETETFTFRRPAWKETRLLLSSTMVVNAQTGQAIVDLYRLIDMKVKMLLTDWTASKDGQKIPMTEENIEKLEPDLVSYLYDRVNEELGSSEVTAVVDKPAKPIEAKPSE